MLDRVNDNGEMASVRYFANDLEILRPGRFVRCAVSNQLIALEDLRYWNAERQEAYASAELAIQRWQALRAGG